jgi:transcriptional regulator with XRE-family HTH domain
MKQKNLAEILDISQSHLSEIENGAKPVTYALLAKYAKTFDLPISAITFFAEIEETENSRRESFPVKVTGKALKLLEWFDSISQFDREKSDKYAEKKS